MLLATVLAAPLSAQTDLRPQELATLPSIEPSGDHPIVAMNDSGDICVAFRTGVNVGSKRVKQIELVFVRRTGGSRWSVPGPGAVQLIGDPNLQELSSWESCEKPKIVSVGQNFLVSWIRVNRWNGRGRLEAALVVVPPTGNPVIDSRIPGAGYTIDDGFQTGHSGRNVGLARKVRPFGQSSGSVENVAVVVHANRINHSAERNEYELLGTWIDFNVSPPTLIGPKVLIPSAIVDEPTNYGEGRIPPYVIEDDKGRLWLSFDEFLKDARTGAATHEGRMTVAIFEEDGPTQSVFELDRLHLYGEDFDHHQRRSVLSTSLNDVDNQVSIAWTEFDQNGQAGRAHHGQLRFDGAFLQFEDFTYPNSANRPVRSSSSLHGDGVRMALVQRTNPVSGLFELVAGDGILEDLTLIPTSGIEPHRPFSIIHDVAGTSLGSRFVPIVFDGPVPSGHNMTFLIVHTL